MLSREQTKVVIFGVSFVSVFILGCVGYAMAFPNDNIADVVYNALQLFALQPASKEFVVNFPLQIARFGAPILLGSSTIGLFLFASGRQMREIFGYRLKNHVLIFGDGELAVKQALQFQKQGDLHKVVLIVQNLNEEIHDELEQKGILVFAGQEGWISALGKARARIAATIVIMIENEEQRSSLKKHLQEYLKKGSRRYLLLVQGEVDPGVEIDPQLLTKTVGQVLNEKNENEHLDVVHFDPHLLAAQKLLTDFGPHHFVPQKWEEKGDKPHVVIFGLGALASTWLKVAAANCHYRADEKMRMTVFYDEKTEAERADSLVHRFSSRKIEGARLERVQRCRTAEYPAVPEADFIQIATEHASRYFDIHFEATNFDRLVSEQVEDILRRRLHVDEKAVVYICLQQDEKSLAVAKVLAGDYDDLDPLVAKCIVCIQQEKVSSRQLKKLSHNSDFMLIFPIEEAFKGDVEMGEISFTESCARDLHRQYLLEPGGVNAPYGKDSHMLWEHLPEEKKLSNRNGVLHFNVKAALFGFATSKHWDFDKLQIEFTNHKKALSRLEHQRWEAQHFAEGWRLGRRKDQDLCHPCLVPYDCLSQEQKDKDLKQVFAVLKSCEQYRKGHSRHDDRPNSH